MSSPVSEAQLESESAEFGRGIFAALEQNSPGYFEARYYTEKFSAQLGAKQRDVSEAAQQFLHLGFDDALARLRAVLVSEQLGEAAREVGPVRCA